MHRARAQLSIAHSTRPAGPTQLLVVRQAESAASTTASTAVAEHKTKCASLRRTQNVLLLILRFTSMTVERQTWALLWLSRLSKYTLVDVSAVIGALVGVQLQLNIRGAVDHLLLLRDSLGVLAD